LDIIRNAGRYEPVGFVDSNPEMMGRRVDGLRVVGQPGFLPQLRRDDGITHAIIAVGNNGARRELALRVRGWDFELINAIHPSANLAGNVTLGSNIVVAAGALVCAHCQIGDSVILNTGCIVDHESLIGTASHVCPGARLAGRVVVEAGAFVGIGATVIQSVRVGCEAVVGAGAVVISDVPSMATVVGVPAHPIKSPTNGTKQPSWLVPELARAESLAAGEPV
jgi:sugar O-acyltransferase (sialic acid O-acetyltransferase NeuD family)